MRNCFIWICLLPLAALSQLQVAPVLSGNMVLPRNKPIHIWGKAWPFKKVSVAFAGQTLTAYAGAEGQWQVEMAPQPAQVQPQTVRITCDNEVLELQNILIGDIWLCSGQSNMEWPMQREAHFDTEKSNAAHPLIRLMNPPPAGRYVYGVAYTDSLNKRLNEKDFYAWNGWHNSDSNTVKSMSAVAYYFAKNIVQHTGIPIGIINLSIGGAPLETFISLTALRSHPQFASKAKGNWLTNEALPQWVRQRGTENVGNNAATDSLGPNHAYKPGFAFQAGIVPLSPLGIAGVLWYQGESNALEPARVEEYKDLQHLLINDYRQHLHNAHLPFYWVQLSSIDTVKYASHYWPHFRDAQRRLLAEVEHGGMAVTSDIGLKNDVHPTNKKEVGLRLSRWALQQVYGKNILPSGPLPQRAVYSRGKVSVSFSYGQGLRTLNGAPLQGFSLDGRTEAPAEIKGEKVIITSRRKPSFIYYGWKPYNEANLVNKEALPASTFKMAVD